jgi:hypothetical protein
MEHEEVIYLSKVVSQTNFTSLGLTTHFTLSHSKYMVPSEGLGRCRNVPSPTQSNRAIFPPKRPAPLVASEQLVWLHSEGLDGNPEVSCTISLLPRRLVGHRTARVGQEGKIARRRWLMPAEIRGSV